MSAFDPAANPPRDPHDPGHVPDAGHAPEHGHTHAHPPHLAHHFDTPEQQFDSAKLGMWAFLATEVLMFGGLFCAYAVYRYNNPNVFRYSEEHLSTTLGAVNTVILLASSLTMALGVRAAQLGQRALLSGLLIATLLGGAGFMVIKGIEYNDKWDHGLFPGRFNAYDRIQNPTGFATHVLKQAGAHGLPGDDAHARDQGQATGEPGDRSVTLEIPQIEGHPAQPVPPAGNPRGAGDLRRLPPEEPGRSPPDPAPPTGGTEHQLPGEATTPHTAPQGERDQSQSLAQLGPSYVDPHAGTNDAAILTPPFRTPAGVIQPPVRGAHAMEYQDLSIRDQANVKAFFSIYFLMTGLHGLHVLIGLGLILWILLRANTVRRRHPILGLTVLAVAAYVIFIALLTQNTAPMASTFAWWIGGMVAVGGLIWLVLGLTLGRRLPEAGADFGPEYFTPVDLVGLYWHLVDLIWIFLFPLLYLIH